MNVHKKLRKAQQTGAFVEITRSIKYASSTVGYVLAVGECWALIAQERDGGYPDGFAAIRIGDVKGIGRHPGVAAQYAATRSDWTKVAPDLDLSSTKRLIRSAGKKYPLVGCEREKKFSDALWIGVPVLVDSRMTWLHEIAPDATWHEEPLGYKTPSITKVELDSDYLRALATVMPPRPDERVVRAKRK